MSNLPGFSKVGGVTKFSELEIDNSFTENMKQLNQKSKIPNQYRWDLKELTLQSDQQITVDYNVLGAIPLHAVGKPYWRLVYDIEDNPLPKVLQEFNINVQEATVGEDNPATISIMDQNYLLLAKQNQDGSMNYEYTMHYKENSALSGGDTLLNYNLLFSTNWIQMENVDTSLNEVISLSTNHILCEDNESNRFRFGLGGNMIESKMILTESSGLDGFKALVGNESFDDVMKTLNGNGTKNTYLLNENAKIKIGANLKVSTEADTPTTGGSE